MSEYISYNFKFGISIPDSKYREIIDKYRIFVSELNEYLREYLEIVDRITGQEMLQGKTADSYKEMAECIGALLYDQLPFVMNVQKGAVDNLIASLEAADGDLY